ncbi:MAG TPA: urease accessory UreF family protein, partial [Acidobacteriota bacterium]|nr:urease accessory UreF family protein [Acidobacteriota bacterium]
MDARCDAFLVARVANRASRTQGRSLCAAAARIFDDPAIRVLDEQARGRTVPAHLA